jgi:hypothetical protein
MHMDAHAQEFFNNTKNRSEIVHPVSEGLLVVAEGAVVVQIARR